MIAIKQDPDLDVREVLRRSPVAEVPGAEKIFQECLRRSTVYQGKVDGEIACVWGLIPPTLLSDTAYLWLITTDIVAEHKFLFVRYSQLFIEDALKIYPMIIGDVLIRNDPAIRWLKWLGAEFAPEEKGRMTFTIRRK